jgi:hypothetical protein
LVDRRIKDDDTDPIDALEHADAEVQTAHVYRICPFPFPRSHLHVRFGATQRTGSSSCRSVDCRVSIVVDKLILRHWSSARRSDEGGGETTNDDFVIVICITKLMHDFDDNANEIALTGRQCAQYVEASGDKP